MQTPSIRLANVDDAEALSTFAASVFALGCPEETAPGDLAAYIAAELPPASFLALFEDPNIFVLLAETTAPPHSAPPTAPCIVAYMVVARPSPHPHLPAATAPAEFRKLYVAQSHHGTGLADTLMQSAIATLQCAGPCPIWLSVFSGNFRAIVFYKKWGFRIVGPQEFLVGADHQKDFLMLRDPEPDSATNG
jgi:ribosomal protein S18 acetylase RimI-like enzyme